MSESWVMGRLFVGSQPTLAEVQDQFDVVVFCAREFQPKWERCKAELVYAPLDDDGTLTQQQLGLALNTARHVVARLSQGRRVLVTCHMGLNRSAFVAALVMSMMSPQSRMSNIIARIRKVRGPLALSNGAFVKALRSLSD